MQLQDQPSQLYLASLPVSVQQSFKLIREREDWAAGNTERLSQSFERLVALDNFGAVIQGAMPGVGAASVAFIIKTLAYLRIEQAVYLLKMLPDEYEGLLLDEALSVVRGLDDTSELFAEKNTLISRLNTLSKLNMLNRIFSQERRNFILSILRKTDEEQL